MVSVDKSKNIILCEMSDSELLELFKKINVSPLRFRKQLNLSDNVSFGNEIEVNSIPLDKAILLTELFNDIYCLENNDRYVVHQEETADAEIVTPILQNNEQHWDTFFEMYAMLYETGATIAGNTSSHLHIGSHKINTPAKLSLLLKTLVVFEPIIFKFGYGYNDAPRAYLKYRDNEHCVFSPMMTPKRVRVFTDQLDKYNFKSPGTMQGYFRDFLSTELMFRPVYNFKNFDFEKLHYGISLDNPGEDHFEVRCFNGTLRPEIAQNNVNLIGSIVEAVITGRIDENYVLTEYEKYKKKRYNFDYKFARIDDEKVGEQYNRLLNGFNKIKMDKALKLADMIFKTDLDKCYFLKQYLKLFRAEPEYVESLMQEKNVFK